MRRFRTIHPEASRLRREQTDAECKFWNVVRNRQLDGYKFKRQVTVGPFIVDFACLEWALVVELDGGHHAEQAEQDAARTRYIEKRGYRVLRFWNEEVLTNLDGICEVVLAELALTPTLSRKRERGQ